MKVKATHSKNNPKRLGKVFVFIKRPEAGNNSFIKSLLGLKSDDLKLKFISYEPHPNATIPKNRIIYLNKKWLPSNIPTPRYLFRYIKNLIKTYFLLKNGKPQIIVCTGVYSFIILRLTLLFIPYKNKVVFRVGLNLYQHLITKHFFVYRQILFLLTSFFIKSVDYFIFSSRAQVTECQNKFAIKKDAKIFVVYNGINIKRAKIDSSQKILARGKNIFARNTRKIISVGRFEKQKDFYTIIKAFSLVQKKIPDCDLILIGDGYQKKDLIQSTKELGIISHVYFLGWKKNVYPYLRNSDIFVYSSFHEGFGYVIIEAMSQGLPVIATDTPHGPPEILDYGKYGIIVPVGDYKKMAQKMIELLSDEDLRKKYKRLSLKWIKKFDERIMLKTYREIFDQIQNNSRKA